MNPETKDALLAGLLPAIRRVEDPGTREEHWSRLRVVAGVEYTAMRAAVKQPPALTSEAADTYVTAALEALRQAHSPAIETRVASVRRVT